MLLGNKKAFFYLFFPKVKKCKGLLLNGFCENANFAGHGFGTDSFERIAGTKTKLKA